MIREMFKTNSGIMFDSARLKAIGLDPATLYPTVLPRPPPITPSSGHTHVAQPLPSSWWTWLFKSPELPPHTAPSTDIGTEEEEDIKDAHSPKFDQLVLSMPWWTLEFVPLRHRYQTNDSKWHSWFG